MRRSILACGLLLACAGMSTAVAAAAGSVGTSGSTSTATTTKTTSTATTSSSRSSAYWSNRIRAYRAATARWLTVIDSRPPRGMSRTPAQSVSRLRQLALVWQRRERAAWLRAVHPPMLHAWYCIHHYEGSWTDPNAPYWGGLQMDYSFQATYGPWLLRHKGTADHWTPLEQIWVAVKAWRVRGFSPWANTARNCGVY